VIHLEPRSNFMQQSQAIVLPSTLKFTGGSVGKVAAKTTERLPFTVRRVSDNEALGKAVSIRYAAYARHVPELADKLRLPEAADYDDDCIVLLAESRLDGTPLGTARLQTNQYRPLPVEASVALPDRMQGRHMAEVTRLGVDNGRIGRVVKSALLKACVMYCQQNGVELAIAAGRAPIDRQYEQLTFVDVFGEGEFVPLVNAGNMPHRVMAFDVQTIEERWTTLKHPLLNFFCHTHHPDIDLGSPSQGRLNRPATVPARPVERPVLPVRELALA
jgi:hypothetical protein